MAIPMKFLSLLKILNKKLTKTIERWFEGQRNWNMPFRIIYEIPNEYFLTTISYILNKVKWAIFSYSY